jgi:hypothetical protein
MTKDVCEKSYNSGIQEINGHAVWQESSLKGKVGQIVYHR